MADVLYMRAQLLVEQSRYEEAGNLLQDILLQEPNNVHALALLSQVKLEQRNPAAAEQLVDSAIGISPDTDYLYFVKARICLYNEKYDDAEKYLQQAIDLNPQDADYFGLWASVKLTRKQYSEALRLADEALELDPEDVLALNVRSTALIKLDRKEESFATIEGALANDPNNAYTHSNYGWGLLEKGDHKKALEHFREALKQNPNAQHAQAGMAEALKAKYVFYRWFLRYSFFMSNLTARYQWGVIIGFYVATRLLKALAVNVPATQPFITPLMILFAVIAFSTWVITPISNLFLRLNRYGKYLLKEDEKMSSNFVGISLLACVTGLALYLLLGDPAWLVMAGVGFAMMVPFGSMFNTTHKTKLKIYAGIMLLLGLGAVYQAFRTGETFNGYFTIFLVGFIAFQWIANFVNIRQSNV